MTELSFNEQSQHQVSHDTKVEDGPSEDEGYCEKHVRIDDEDLPVVYKPKSYSNLVVDTNYEHIIHQHPALKFSIASSNIDINTLLPRKPEPNQSSSCSPFFQRRGKITRSTLSKLSTSPKWKKSEMSRKRGKSYPPTTDSLESSSEHTSTDTKTLNDNQTSSSVIDSPRWFRTIRKRITNFSGFNKNKGQSRQKNGSFSDLPPIRVCVSMDNLDGDDTNNNNELTREDESYIFNQTKSYRPAFECRKLSKHEVDDFKQVALKRVNSLPIL